MADTGPRYVETLPETLYKNIKIISASRARGAFFVSPGILCQKNSTDGLKTMVVHQYVENKVQTQISCQTVSLLRITCVFSHVEQDPQF